MRLQDIMTRDVATVAADDKAEAAWTLMQARRIRHLVVKSGKDVVGILSDRDLGGRGGVTLRRGKTIRDLMTTGAVTAPPETTVRRAANIFRGRTIGCLPVTSNGRVVGIVTTADLLELLGRGVEKPIVSTRRWTLKHRGPRRPAGRGATIAR